MDEYRERIGIPEDHELVMVDSSNKVRHGRDTDIDIYEQRDPEGNVVARFKITDSTSTYPPFGRNWDYERI